MLSRCAGRANPGHDGARSHLAGLLIVISPTAIVRGVSAASHMIVDGGTVTPISAAGWIEAIAIACSASANPQATMSVSYTHLDVYKRQAHEAASRRIIVLGRAVHDLEANRFASVTTRCTPLLANDPDDTEALLLGGLAAGARGHTEHAAQMCIRDRNIFP